MCLDGDGLDGGVASLAADNKDLVFGEGVGNQLRTCPTAAITAVSLLASFDSIPSRHPILGAIIRRVWGKLQAQHDISGHDALAVAGEEDGEEAEERRGGRRRG